MVSYLWPHPMDGQDDSWRCEKKVLEFLTFCFLLFWFLFSVYFLKWIYKYCNAFAIPPELSQILKDDAAKVWHSICQQNWKTEQWPQDWKMPVFILIPKKGNAKECSNYHTIVLISHASKVMLKIFQARLQQYENFQMYKVDLEKAEEPKIKLPTSIGSQKKQENFRKKHLLLLHWLCKSCWLCGSQQTVENA